LRQAGDNAKDLALIVVALPEADKAIQKLIDSEIEKALKKYKVPTG
jgi:hypothetical protein